VHIGRQEELVARLGQHIGADVAAVQDQVLLGGDPALKLDQAQANGRQRADIGGGTRNIRCPDRLADVFPVQQDLLVAAEKADVQAGLAKQTLHVGFRTHVRSGS